MTPACGKRKVGGVELLRTSIHDQLGWILPRLTLTVNRQAPPGLSHTRNQRRGHQGALLRDLQVLANALGSRTDRGQPA